MYSGNQLIIALDVAGVKEAEAIVDEIGDAGTFYKIGHQLGFAGGLEFAGELIKSGKHVFLDMKLLDIDNTVAKGVESIARMGVTMLTIHAYPKAMGAAVAAARESDICLLAVSVLTSMDDQDLANAGYGYKARELVEIRAKQALDAGMGGIVASAQEATMIKALVGDKLAIVTPGIRPQGADIGDQKRVMTPGKAISAGATHLVVGRPIIAAEDRRQAVVQILDEIKSGIEG